MLSNSTCTATQWDHEIKQFLTNNAAVPRPRLDDAAAPSGGAAGGANANANANAKWKGVYSFGGQAGFDGRGGFTCLHSSTCFRLISAAFISLLFVPLTTAHTCEHGVSPSSTSAG